MLCVGSWTPASDRLSAATRMEPILRAGLSRASSTEAKTAWFAAFESVALTPASVSWLERIWRREITVPGLPLSESDQANLAATLALRDVPGTDAILQEQLQRFQNADRKARFAFVMRALARNS